jgi:purine-binding chemotaxis protein CheW
MTAGLPVPPPPGRALIGAGPGKYLIIRLGAASYGMPVLTVREIIRLCPVTPVANMPAHVRGVINLRGRVIPLVDLRIRFGLPVRADDDRTCVVVTQVAAAGGGMRPYGVVVDGVEEVASFGDHDLEPVPDFGGAIDARFLTGMAKTTAGVVALIDLEAMAATEHETVPTDHLSRTEA